MLELLDTFRIRLAGRPLLLVTLIILVFLVRWRRHSDPASTNAWATWVQRVTVGVGLAGLLIYPSIAIWYASDWHFFDNAEPTIPAIGWLYQSGGSLYHSPEAPQRYAHIYGPMAFVLHGWALWLFGPSISVSKALGAAAAILSLGLLYRAIRLHHSVLGSSTLTGVCALVLLCFRHYSFWTRPDPLQLLSVSAALLFAARGQAVSSAVVVGLMSGLMWNLKFTGPLYTLPIVALVYRRLGSTPAAIAVCLALVVAALPFASPSISLVNYVSWVQLSAHTGLLLTLLKQNIEWASYLGLPIFLSYFARSPERRPSDPAWRFLVVALFLGTCGVILSAAKPGAGPYHLIPFLPIVFYVVAIHTAGYSSIETRDAIVPRGMLAFLVVAICIAVAQQAQFVTTISARRLVHEAEDIQRFVDNHEGTVAMGYGHTEALSLLRPMLVFRYDTYLLDQPAVREYQLAGIEVPKSTSEALARCEVAYWLIPKGESPFSGVNSYAAVAGRAMYPADFRRIFAETHTRVDATTYYDVWRCHSTPARK